MVSQKNLLKKLRVYKARIELSGEPRDTPLGEDV